MTSKNLSIERFGNRYRVSISYQIQKNDLLIYYDLLNIYCCNYAYDDDNIILLEKNNSIISILRIKDFDKIDIKK